VAQLIWTEPALSDLEAIADYIALDDPAAASEFVAKVFLHVEQLAAYPKSGSLPKELRPNQVYRQIIERPCRIFYRISESKIYIVHVMRSERILRRKDLARKSS